MRTDLVLACFALVAGCKQDRPPLPPQPIGETHTTSAEVRTAPGSRESTGEGEGELVRVVATSRIRAKCGMPSDSPAPAMFAFDGKQLQPQGEDILGAVGRCASSATDAQLCVAGYVGPGQTETYEAPTQTYEAALVRAQADAAARDLERAGVGRERITIVVRGGEIVSGSGGVVAPPVEREVQIDLRNGAPCTGWQ